MFAGLMGLDYDPDSLFRRELSLLDPSTDDAESRLDLFISATISKQISCVWSDSAMPLNSTENETASTATRSESIPYHGYLGTYSPEQGKITINGPAVEEVASRTNLKERYVGSVTLIHLSALALMHQGEDADGRRWEGFSLGDPSPWIGGVPLPTLALAQFYTRRLLERLDDSNLIHAFETLSEKQPPAYSAWKNMEHISLETARAWLTALRRGAGGPSLRDLDDILK